KLSVTSVQGSIGNAGFLERIYFKGVEEVVVTRKDRLCCFRSKFVEWIFEKNETRLVPMIANMESLQKTYLQSSQCLWRDIMDYVRPQIAEGEEKLPKRFKSFKKEVKKLSAGKVRHIRIYPNRQEQPKLRRWMGTACYHVE